MGYSNSFKQQIKDEYASGEVSQTELATKYKLSTKTVWEWCKAVNKGDTDTDMEALRAKDAFSTLMHVGLTDKVAYKQLAKIIRNSKDDKVRLDGIKLYAEIRKHYKVKELENNINILNANSNGSLLDAV